MREIQFRVWDKASRKYLPPRQTLIDGKGNLLNLLESDNNCIIGTVCRTGCLRRNREPELIIEQSTGLTDKDGIEIYEGDIVQYYPRHNGVPYRVYWADESAKFLIGRKGVVGQELSSIMYNLDTGRIALEVIGNIHENPELLEEEK